MVDAGKIYDDKILEALDTKPVVDGDMIELSSGVILKCKPIPILRVNALMNRFKYPPVPELYDDKKDRYIRNPNSPEYVAMKEAVDIERTLAVIDIAVASGTELTYAPDNIAQLEDDEWLKELVDTQVLLSIPESKAGRYLAWVKYVAIVTTDDTHKIAEAAGLGLGVSEKKVAESLQNSFQDH